MSDAHFRITQAKALTGSRLALVFADGVEFIVDLAAIIERHPSLARLAKPQLFAQVAVTDDGHTLTWAGDDALQLAADNLRARSIEQTGGVSHEFLWNWMHKHDLTLDVAAAALGLSRRMLAYYRSGEKSIPLTVGLACLGWEKAAAVGKDSCFALAA